MRSILRIGRFGVGIHWSGVFPPFLAAPSAVRYRLFPAGRRLAVFWWRFFVLIDLE